MSFTDNAQGILISPRIGAGVRGLLIACVAVFALQVPADRWTHDLFTHLFALQTGAVLHGWFWQLFTYMFLHGSLWHLLLNMIGLFFFGREMEETLGLRKFLALYLLCGIAGAVGWLLLSGDPGAHCLGASGAVFGTMGAFAALFPFRRVTVLLFFVLPVTLTARTLVLGLGAVTVYSLFASDGNIAHAAHLAGGVAGYLYGRARAKRWDRGGSRRSFFGRRKTHPRFRIQPDEEPPSREEIDRILEKASATGIRGLYPSEREALDRASRQTPGSQTHP